MKRVGIAELKAHLSRYLAEVQAGETIIVCDRQRPVATLSGEVNERPQLTIREPTEPLSRLEDLLPPLSKQRVDVVEILRELRQDSWERT